MRVWTNPELIVDELALSQFCVSGCDIKSKDNKSDYYEFWHKSAGSGNIKDKTYSFSQLLDADSRPKDRTLTQNEVVQYYLNHGGDKNHNRFGSGALGKLQDS